MVKHCDYYYDRCPTDKATTAAAAYINAQAQHFLHRNAEALLLPLQLVAHRYSNMGSTATFPSQAQRPPFTHTPATHRRIEIGRFRAWPKNPHRQNKTDATSCDAQAQRIQRRPQHETHGHSEKCSVHSYYYLSPLPVVKS